MKFDNPILFFICSIGVFNGLLVSLYFLFFNKQKRIPNFIFGLLVLFLSIRIGKSVYVIFTERTELNRLYLQIGLSTCFLIGISLFYYLKSSLENTKKIPKLWKLHFLLLVLIVLVVGIIKPYETNIPFWHTFFVPFIYVIWGLYMVASAYLLKDLVVKLFNKTEKLATSEIWLLSVYLGNLLIYLAYIVGFFYLYLAGTITFSVVFYGLTIFFLSKKQRESIFQEIPQKYASKKIESNEANSLIEKLNALMLEQELYKNSDIKLNDIAKELKITTHQLSQLLNDNLGKSFATFINEFRIAETKKLLQENNQFTLEAIGFEAGFSSKSNFYATFKKIVGTTPSEFKKQNKT